ncbi:MAG: hypothetical protein RSB88_09195, partial [Akkermansia sp.]
TFLVAGWGLDENLMHCLRLTQHVLHQIHLMLIGEFSSEIWGRVPTFIFFIAHKKSLVRIKLTRDDD